MLFSFVIRTKFCSSESLSTLSQFFSKPGPYTVPEPFLKTEPYLDVIVLNCKNTYLLCYLFRILFVFVFPVNHKNLPENFPVLSLRTFLSLSLSSRILIFSPCQHCLMTPHIQKTFQFSDSGEPNSSGNTNHDTNLSRFLVVNFDALSAKKFLQYSSCGTIFPVL